MDLKRRLTRSLMAALPRDEQIAMVQDFVDWLYADLSPAERKVKAGRIAPRLIEWISNGEIGLPLVLLQHFKRLRIVRVFGHRVLVSKTWRDETLT